MRVSTGIPGLDELIGGGFPDPSIVLVLGPPGAGKSVLSLQFLMHGARAGERGLYVTTLSEKFSWMARFMSGFEFFDKGAFEKELILYEDMAKYIRGDEMMFLNKLREAIAIYMPKRIVIDPINPLREYIDRYREFLFDLVDMLKKWGGTVIMTAEKNSGYDDEMYMADGIIELTFAKEGDIIRRYLRIVKMRGTNHSLAVHPFSISDKGIEVLKANF